MEAPEFECRRGGGKEATVKEEEEVKEETEKEEMKEETGKEMGMEMEMEKEKEKEKGGDVAREWWVTWDASCSCSSSSNSGHLSTHSVVLVDSTSTWGSVIKSPAALAAASRYGLRVAVNGTLLPTPGPVPVGATVADTLRELPTGTAGAAGGVFRLAVAGGGLPGGKGGFGSNLRSAGRAAIKQQTRDFRMCRDLSGRRLVDVNNEVRLRKWLSPAEEAKRRALGESYEEARGTAGIAGWHLAVPSWADRVAVTNPYADAARARRKTALCRQWVDARADRPAPPGAPRWWGCPRGRDCPFAHGDEELRREAKVAAATARRDATYRRYERELQEYTAGMYVYSADADADANGGGGGGGGGGSSGGGGGGRSMLASVMVGMRALDGTAGMPPAPAPAPTTLPARQHVEETAGGGVAGTKRRRDADSSSSSSSSSSNSGEDAAAAAADATRPDASHPVATLPPAASPPTLPWLPRDWVASLTGAGDDAAVEYFDGGGGGSDSGGDGVASVAEVEGRGDFASLAATGVAAVVGALPSTCYYDVELLTDGIVQVGWCDPGFTADMAAGSGVGDHTHSWAFDGARGLRWNGDAVEYGRKWAEGDTVRATVSIEPRAGSSGSSAAGGDGSSAAGGDGSSGSSAAEGDGSGSCRVTFSFAINGEDLGPAFVLSGVPHGTQFYPALSLETGEVVRWRLPPPPALPRMDCSSSSSSSSSSTTGSLPPPVPAAADAADRPPPPFDISRATSLAAVRAAGWDGDVLKAELAARGLKAGGTWEERAARLVAVHALAPADYPAKLRSK